MALVPSLTSPNKANYHVGRGILYMKLPTDGSFIDMGNCTKFTFTATPTRLDHYSSRVGIRKKDLTVVTQLDCKLALTLEEFTARNMAAYVLGTALQSGSESIDIMSDPLFYCALRFIATNSVGPQWNAEFPSVLLSPSGSFSLIAEGSGQWSAMEMEGDVQFDEGSQQYGWLYSNSFA